MREIPGRVLDRNPGAHDNRTPDQIGCLPVRTGAGSAIAQIGVVAVNYVAIATRDPLAGTFRSSSLKLDAIAANGDWRGEVR
jgi:hypothetical protein